MNTEQIDCFLELVNAGSLSKASDRLHLSQSAVSKQLVALERELGVPLVMRGKGVRQIKLTEAGKRFMDIAQDYMKLKRDMMDLRYSYSGERLRVGCSDNICHYIFAPFFRDYERRLGSHKLMLQVNHPSELFVSLLQHNTDIVYTHAHTTDKSAVSTPLYSESYYLVINDGLGIWEGETDISALDPNNEVFTAWNSEEFLEWHMKIWGEAQYVGVTVVSTTMMFLSQPGYWGYLPTSLAEVLVREGATFSTYKAHSEPPSRICYVTERATGGQYTNPMVNQLKEEVVQYLKTFKSIELLV